MSFTVNDDVSRQVFRSFARVHPHEAAEQNWEEFYAMVKEVNPKVTEEVARRLLKETEDQ